jgi:hypothetical protein
MFRRTRLVPLGIARRELIGERRPTAGDPGSHGSGRNAEYFADLGVVEAHEVTERDGGAVIGRELGEGGVDVELVGDEVVDGGTRPAGLGDDIDGRRSASASQGLVEGSIGGDAVAPRRETRASVERVDLAGNREECLLRRIERILGMREHTPANRVHQTGVAAQESVERIAVAARGRGGECIVAFVAFHYGNGRPALVTEHWLNLRVRSR